MNALISNLVVDLLRVFKSFGNISRIGPITNPFLAVLILMWLERVLDWWYYVTEFITPSISSIWLNFSIYLAAELIKPIIVIKLLGLLMGLRQYTHLVQKIVLMRALTILISIKDVLPNSSMLYDPYIYEDKLTSTLKLSGVMPLQQVYYYRGEKLMPDNIIRSGIYLKVVYDAKMIKPTNLLKTVEEMYFRAYNNRIKGVCSTVLVVPIARCKTMWQARKKIRARINGGLHIRLLYDMWLEFWSWWFTCTLEFLLILSLLRGFFIWYGKA